MTPGAAALSTSAAEVQSLSAEKGASAAEVGASATPAEVAPPPKLDLTTSEAKTAIADTLKTAKTEAEFISAVKDKLLPNLTPEERASFDASAEGVAANESLGLTFIKAAAVQAATVNQDASVSSQFQALTSGLAMEQMSTSQQSVLSSNILDSLWAGRVGN